MENAASILLRASQHPEKLRKALLYNGECFAPEDYRTGKISACVLSSGSSLMHQSVCHHGSSESLNICTLM